MFATTDLVPLMAERGIHLSREQVFRFDVGVEDLIETTAATTQVAKTAGQMKPGTPPAVRRTTIRRPDRQ